MDYWEVFKNVDDVTRYMDSSTRTYTLTLTDPGTADGYRLSYSADISVFDFFNLMNEFFNVEVTLDYIGEDEETLREED